MKKKYLIMILIFIITLLPLGITLSRYVIDKVADYIMEANNFYFSSDKLTKEGANYQVNNWSGVGTFTIQFNLNNMKNNILSSTSDIDYELNITCPADVICSLSSETGIIYAAEKTKDFVIVATPLKAFNDNESITIDVVAKSLSPYKKTLKASFVIIVGKRGISYEIEDEANRPYLDFTITNALTSYKIDTAFGSYSVGDEISSDDYLKLTAAEKTKCTSALVTLKFDPNEVIIDSTSSIMKNAIKKYTTVNNIDYISEITFKVDAVSSNVIRFYKIDNSKNYTYPFVTTTSVIQFSVEGSFEGVYDGKEFMITFDANGGTVPTNNMLVYYNHLVGPLPTPTNGSYIFAGWYTEAKGGNKVTENTTYLQTSNIILYAHWQTKYNFDYTGSEQIITIPESGLYKIEVWGAQGGYAGSNDYQGGYGSYSVGYINLIRNDELYIYVGGKGTDGTEMLATTFAGGFNGGGNGKGNTNKYNGAGGGATHIALSSGLLSTLNNNLNSILIVAGGGGGSGMQTNIKYGYGGSGGGFAGVSGMKYDEDNKTWKIGTGGTQSEAGTGYANGSFGKGGTYSGVDSPGGGGGFYGGGAGQYYAGAGGGSGYIGNANLSDKAMYCYNCLESVNESTKTISTTNVSVLPVEGYAKSGNGYAIITFIE